MACVFGNRRSIITKFFRSPVLWSIELRVPFLARISIGAPVAPFRHRLWCAGLQRSACSCCNLPSCNCTEAWLQDLQRHFSWGFPLGNSSFCPCASEPSFPTDRFVGRTGTTPTGTHQHRRPWQRERESGIERTSLLQYKFENDGVMDQ